MIFNCFLPFFHWTKAKRIRKLTGSLLAILVAELNTGFAEEIWNGDRISAHRSSEAPTCARWLAALDAIDHPKLVKVACKGRGLYPAVN